MHPFQILTIVYVGVVVTSTTHFQSMAYTITNIN